MDEAKNLYRRWLFGLLGVCLAVKLVPMIDWNERRPSLWWRHARNTVAAIECLVDHPPRWSEVRATWSVRSGVVVSFSGPNVPSALWWIELRLLPVPHATRAFTEICLF